MDTREDKLTKMRETILANRKAFEGNNVTFEDSQKVYDRIAEAYDEMSFAVNASSYSVLAKAVASLYPSETRSSVEILDIGAGTGRVGLELRQLGFDHIDALDPNEQMMKSAKELNRYRNYYTERVSSEEKSSIKNGCYDIVTAVGVFAESGHIPPDEIPNMARMAKSGGHVAIVCRMLSETALAPIESAMNALEAGKIWHKLSRDIWSGYNEATGGCGITWTFKMQ